MAKKMKAQKTIRAITPKELKFWLEGILEFQTKDWIPNAEQWKAIQEKIFNLDDTAPIMMAQPATGTTAQGNRQSIQHTGGHTGLPENLFHEPASPEAIAAAGFDVPIVGAVPKADASGFLRMPDSFVDVGNTVQPSGGGKVHKFRPDGFN
jgi:hypothetical protein